MKRAKALPLPLEYQTQIAIADALRSACAPGWRWSHFPAGEARPSFMSAKGKRVVPAAVKLARMGLQRGWPDLLLISPEGVHHWLELKRGKAPMSEDQEAFRDNALAIGVPWALARSFDEAIAQLVAWGALRLAVAA